MLTRMQQLFILIIMTKPICKLWNKNVIVVFVDFEEETLCSWSLSGCDKQREARFWSRDGTG